MATTKMQGRAVNYEVYPFGREESAPSGYIYAFVRDQVSFLTGTYDIECPHCRKRGTGYVSGLREGTRLGDRKFRRVRTACRHCGTEITFDWRR